MKIGSKLAANQELVLAHNPHVPNPWQLDFEAYRTRTDAAGRFTIAQAPPGEHQLVRAIPTGRGWSQSNPQRLTIKPGEVTHVTYGGTGRPVIGKVVPSDPDRKVEWTSGRHLLRTQLPQPPSDSRTPAEARAWLYSPEFKAALANHRSYAPTWQADGSFRIDDVVAGSYQLGLNFLEPTVGFPQTTVGEISRFVEVPEIPGGQSDEPLDLGELPLELRSEPDPVADPARETEPAPQPGAAAREGVQKSPGAPRDSAAPGEAASPAGSTPATTAPPPPQSTAIIRDTAPPEMKGINPRFWAVAYAPDGRTIATTAGWDDPREPGELVLWDVATGQARVVIRQESTIRTTAFSPDGRRIAMGDFAGNVAILDPTDGRIVKALPQQTKLVNSVGFTPDGRTLASGGFDETVRLWDTETGEARRTFVLPGQGVTKLAISADGQWLAAGTRTGLVHVWRLASGEKAHELDAGLPDGSGSSIEAVEFSPDGRQLVTGSWDGAFQLWSVQDGKAVRDFPRSRNGVMAAAFSPGGRWLVRSDARGVVEFWWVETGERVGEIAAHQGMCFGLAFSPDGKRLATAGWDRVLNLWDVVSRRPVATLSRSDSSP